MMRRAYVVGGLTAAAVLGTLVLSSTAARPLMGASSPFRSTQPGMPPRGHSARVAVVSDDGLFPAWLTIGVTTLLLLYAAGLLLLVVMHRRGRLDTESPRLPGAEDDPDEVVWQTLLGVELGEAARDQLADIGLGTARDAIIACWLRLHAATQRAGLEPLRSETPQEFTERVLRTLRVDENAVTDLATLYREARFSDHPMSDAQRQQAAAALTVLAGQLAGRPVPA